jgi:hypothetical protein
MKNAGLGMLDGFLFMTVGGDVFGVPHRAETHTFSRQVGDESGEPVVMCVVAHPCARRVSCQPNAALDRTV